jgi:autotransporter-associated beta strand protein
MNRDRMFSVAWILAAVAIGVLGPTTAVHATAYYWDTNGTDAGTNTTNDGIWGTDAYFSTDANGAAATSNPVTTTGDDLTFSAGTNGTGAAAVTVSGGQSIHNLTFQEGQVALGGGTITFGGSTPTLNVAASPVAATISSTIAGSVGLTKSGAGALTLSGANNFTGGTFSMSAGTLNIGNAAALNGSNQLRFTAAGTFDNTSGGSITLSGNPGFYTNYVVTFLGAADGSHNLNLGTGLPLFGISNFLNILAGEVTIGGSNPSAGAMWKKRGPGTLTVGGSYAGNGAIIESGPVNLNNGGATGTNTYIGQTTAPAYPIVIDNTSGSLVTMPFSTMWTWRQDFTFKGTNNMTLGRASITDAAASGNRTITVQAGTLTFADAIYHMNDKTFSVTKDGAGKLVLSKYEWSSYDPGPPPVTSYFHYTGGTIIKAGTMQFQLDAHPLVLTVAAGADIQGGKVVLDYTGGTTTAPTVATDLQTSYGLGWASGQIRSTTAAADLTHTHALGWVDDTAHSQVTVMYTLYGDTNLDGSVDGTDLNAVLSNYDTTSGAVWAAGDFNYDGSVDGTDLNTVLSNYDQHLSVGAAVPEPSTLLLGAAGLAGLLAYARRKR